MGLLEFNKLPINTLVGADWKTFKAITAGREIDPAYRGKYGLQKLYAVCFPHWHPCRKTDTGNCWLTSLWNMIRSLYSDIGVAGLLLCTMCSLVTSISGIILPIRLCSLI